MPGLSVLWPAWALLDRLKQRRTLLDRPHGAVKGRCRIFSLSQIGRSPSQLRNLKQAPQDRPETLSDKRDALRQRWALSYQCQCGPGIPNQSGALRETNAGPRISEIMSHSRKRRKLAYGPWSIYGPVRGARTLPPGRYESQVCAIGLSQVASKPGGRSDPHRTL